jgi:signal transduction histidine kinase
MFSYKTILPLLATNITNIIIVVLFSGYFFFQYSNEMEKRMYANIDEYGEIDLHHLCNLTSCRGIFHDEHYYGIDEETQQIDLQNSDTTVKMAEEFYKYQNVSLRHDLTFVVPIQPEDQRYPTYFIIDISKFIPNFLLLLGILTLVFNAVAAITVNILLKREKTLHDIESSKDKTGLQFDNLMFYIENLNHEVNSPLFVLSRKLKDLKTKVGYECDETFEVITNSIEQINAVMQRTREVKRINKISDDRTIYDLVKSTIITVKVMRSENIDIEIDKKLDKYYLDQSAVTNGTFINILTNHIKNSIEAYSSTLTSTFISVYKNKLTFTFADDGNGIPEEFKSKVFEKGFSTKGSKMQRGSGMSINKDIIDSVGGSISINNSFEGTEIQITIPVKEKQYENL